LVKYTFDKSRFGVRIAEESKKNSLGLLKLGCNKRELAERFKAVSLKLIWS
jgi:hypothetical protein